MMLLLYHVEIIAYILKRGDTGFVVVVVIVCNECVCGLYINDLHLDQTSGGAVRTADIGIRSQG